MMPRHGENIYKRKDGRYEGRYVIGKNEKGQTKFGYIYGRKYTDVRNRLLMKKAEQCPLHANVLHFPPVTLREWMRRWLASEVLHSVKPSSYQTYLCQTQKHILPALGSSYLHLLTPEVLRAFLADLQDQNLAPATVKGIYRLLSSALQSGVEIGLVAHNPCDRVRQPAAKRSRQRVLTTKEQQLVLTKAQQVEQLPTLLALHTGMRLGEICALKWSDVDFERGMITVNSTVQRVRMPEQDGCRPRTTLLVSTPKSAQSFRSIPMNMVLVQALQQRAAKAPDGTFVLSASDHPMDPRTVQRQFKQFISETGLKNVHFHTMRHSFATRLIELGVDVKTVSVLLGHSSVQTTLDYYVHSLLDQQRLAVDKLAVG